MKKAWKILRIILAVWLIFIVICVVVPPLFHKSIDPLSASAETETETITASNGALAEAAERVRSIDTNMEALLWRLRLIEAAQERIVLTTFDFRDDNSGQDMMAALFHAAERGVKVQILVDGINGTLWLTGSDHFRELAAHENVEAKLYNPIDLFMPWTWNYRMHDKYLIADDFAYILGGRNTDDLFLGNYAESYNEDRDILVYETAPGQGQSYGQLQDYFERIWNLPCCKSFSKKGGGSADLEAHYEAVRTKYPEAFTETDWHKETMETEGIRLCTNPIEAENKVPLLWESMIEEMKQGTEVLIQTPYVICNDKMYQDLTEVTACGATVEILLNAVESGTNPFGCTDYLNQGENIRKTGSHTYEYLAEQALHTKSILIGEDISIVGSCNLDMRSIYLDTEMMLVIDCPELNASLREQTEALKASSLHVLPDESVEKGAEYPEIRQGIGKKVFYGLLRVLIVPFRHLL